MEEFDPGAETVWPSIRAEVVAATEPYRVEDEIRRGRGAGIREEREPT
jgi:hypothetical protein